MPILNDTVDVNLLNIMTEKYFTIAELSNELDCHERTIQRQLEKIEKIKCIDMQKTDTGKYCIRTSLRR